MIDESIKTKFFAELKRRNEMRMAGLYRVASRLIVQIAETLLPILPQTRLGAADPGGAAGTGLSASPGVLPHPEK